jgi:hypothetical protein
MIPNDPTGSTYNQPRVVHQMPVHMSNGAWIVRIDGSYVAVLAVALVAVVALVVLGRLAQRPR